MKRLRLLVVATLLFAGFIMAAAPTLLRAQANTPQDLVQLVNAYRAAHGRPPFEVNDTLVAVAQRHVNWMATTGNYGHTGEGGSTPQQRATAAGYRGFIWENWAGGTLGYASTEWAMQFWDSSPIHKQGLLSDNIHIGAGVAQNDRDILFVLVLGRPSDYAPAAGGSAERGGPGDAGGAPPDSPDSLAEPEAPPIIVVPVVVATAEADGSVHHVVQTGQTAWVIAARYGVPLDTLLALNSLERTDTLYPGDALIIRLGPGQAPPPSPTPPTTHIAQEGETYWTIAAQYGLTLDELLTLNGKQRGDILQPGDTVLLHGAVVTATPDSAGGITSPAPLELITGTPPAPTDEVDAVAVAGSATMMSVSPVPEAGHSAPLSSVSPVPTGFSLSTVTPVLTGPAGAAPGVAALPTDETGSVGMGTAIAITVTASPTASLTLVPSPTPPSTPPLAEAPRPGEGEVTLWPFFAVVVALLAITTVNSLAGWRKRRP